MKPAFANRHNEFVHARDGRGFWISRACAVVAEVCLYNRVTDAWYVLLGERGTATPDFQGYWGLPCGYLDWDETLCEAVVREVWEECGLYLPALAQEARFLGSTSSCILQPSDFTDTPWLIMDTPTDAKQNISLHFALLFSWDGAPFPALSAANADPDEVGELGWIRIEDALGMDLAFNHQARIHQLWTEKQAWFDALARPAPPPSR